jgi:phosphodiesterase/alkaline phosphatase D-like protein
LDNDIKDVMAPGDLNVMEVWGDEITIAYNTAIDAITGSAGGSHTDFIQTWNTHSNWHTTNLRVIGNRATGEPDDARESVNTHFNQALIGEGASCSSGGGGSGQSGDWFISDNYWTADCKFCDIDDVTYTRNTFAGIDKRAVVIQGGSANFQYYSDNRIADGGRATVEIGASVIPGPGPANPHWYGKGGNFSNTPGAGGGGGGGSVPGGTASLVHRVVGIPSTTSVPVAVRVTSGTTSVRLQVSTSPTFASGIISGPVVTPNAQGDAQLTVTGLAANTVYYQRVGVTAGGTSGGTEKYTAVSSVPFRTAPTGQTNFAFCFSSSDESGNATTLATIAARGDAFFFHLGDLYYKDAAPSTVAQMRTEMAATIQASNYKALFDTTPISYTPSDHDALSPDTTFGSDPTAWANWNQVYRELIPQLSRPAGSMGVYHTFTWGRVRFIQLDTQSFASNPTASDNSSKTVLGATQKQWLKDQITAATEQVIVLVQASVWVGAQTNDPTWVWYSTERAELAAFFTASGKNICMLGSDMRALAAHNGVSGSPGGIAVFQAGPLRHVSAHKGGPYTVGPVPAIGSTVQLYGRIAVTDTGTQIQLAFTGYNSTNTELASLTKTYNVTGGGGGGGTASLVHRVVGIPSTSSVPMAVRTSGATAVRLQVSTSSTFSSGIISGSSVTPNAQGDSQLTVSGLAAGTTYYHRCGVTTGGVEGFTPVSSKPFTTAPTGQTNFAFCFASCDETSNATTPATIANRNDAFFLHLGDLYYNDGASSSVSNFRTEMVDKIQASNYKTLFDTTPISYTPSDHDGMENNDNFGTHPTNWTNWNQVHRELFPQLSRPGGSMGIYTTWTWGRLRFIQLDTRSFASSASASDNSSKTMLGATQKQWLKDTISNDSTSKVFVLVQDTVWMGSASSGNQTWRGWNTERTELANFFSASGKNICMLGGDMHAVAANNGTGSPGGIAVFQAAPLSNDVSHEPGPWTAGPEPGTGSKTQQYGRIVVTDTGTQIALAFTGHSSTNAVRTTLTKTYNV